MDGVGGNEDDFVSPALATSWTTSLDATTGHYTITFKLRTGVTFHDGSAWNAAAAVTAQTAVRGWQARLAARARRERRKETFVGRAVDRPLRALQLPPHAAPARGEDERRVRELPHDAREREARLRLRPDDAQVVEALRMAAFKARQQPRD